MSLPMPSRVELVHMAPPEEMIFGNAVWQVRRKGSGFIARCDDYGLTAEAASKEKLADAIIEALRS